MRALGLDVGTLVTVLFVVCTVLAGLLALTWAQNRSVPAFGVWTVCFALCAIAAGILAARNRLPAFLAIDIANALRFLAFGLGWQAARQFTRQKGSWTFALAPTLIWIAACVAFQVYGVDMRMRIIIASPVIVAYATALACELWRAAPRFRWIARPAAAVLGLHAVIFAARFVNAAVPSEWSFTSGGDIAGPLSPFAILEMVVVAIALAFLLLSAAKEEIGMQHRQAALLDPLTGVSNRRGFDGEVERVFASASRDHAPMSLLMFDIDHFKEINDSFGHPAGDRILRTLTRTVAAHLRPDDVLGRLGGDEFGILLPNTRMEQALILAERVRRAVAGMIVRTDPGIRFTASIGVAGLSQADSLEILFERADAALYRAKARGRNRVESALGRRLPTEPRPLRVEEQAMQRVA